MLLYTHNMHAVYRLSIVHTSHAWPISHESGIITLAGVSFRKLELKDERQNELYLQFLYVHSR